MLQLIVSATIITLVSAAPITPPVVTTKTGQLKGRLINFQPAQQVYEFTAIPFAEPPTGSLRFKKPVSKAPWQGVLDATTMPKVCPQSVDSSFANISAALAAAMQPVKNNLKNERCFCHALLLPEPGYEAEFEK